MTTLLAVPNFSEGRDEQTIDALGHALVSRGDVHLLATHRDPDHNRCVFTLAGAPGALAPALLAGARVAVERIDLRRHEGVHPHVGALDVAPIVQLSDADRGAACAEALVTADLLARQLDLPVLMYGALAQGRMRAELRRGGPAELARRLAAGELTSDFGPARAHPTAGATLVAARPPLVAFNVTLRPPTSLQTAREIAACIREGGPAGLPGLRAIGLRLEQQQQIQISMNVERPDLTPLREVVQAIARHAEPAAAELIGLAPEQAFEGFPPDLPIPGFDPDAHLIERALARLRPHHLSSKGAMAQTKKKRQTKHRGNAAGQIEARGRTGRRPTATEGKPTARELREARLDQPPTWRAALNRALIAAALFLILLLFFFRHQQLGPKLAIAVFMLAVYVPMGYYTDLFIYRRRQARRLREQAAKREPTPRGR